ncbi:GyrI-like domain-containing protein [Anaerosporobacter faecicola]|uniref:GyrI-like domain-containing protein n=1 Tax=Anaerosporobacter faecicola TaxID=2718714 RepID=UPI00143992D6|nr:effector binding domain-containing protein [Anaerosporobacter faecicola]
MFKDIVEQSEKKYLGFGITIPWENNIEIQFDFWKRNLENGKIEALKEFCHAEEVYGLFCYRCNCDRKTFSYHIVCENKQNKKDKQYEELTLYASDFARFVHTYEDRKQIYTQYTALCDEIWGKWLPNSDYVSLIELETNGCIEGYASIERYQCNNPTFTPNEFEIWIPVSKIQQL